MGVMTQARLPSKKCHDTLTGVSGKSGRGTARQTIRVDEALWTAFGTACEEQDTDRSSVVRAFIARYLRDPVAMLAELAKED